MECSRGGKAGGGSGLEGRRSQKAESRRGDWKEEWLVPYLLRGLQIIDNKEDFSDTERREGSGGWKSQPPIEREGNRKKRKDSPRPSHGRQNGTETDLDAISECLTSDRGRIEGMKIASENGDYGVPKVG
jgi:hypothetical protein